MHARQRKRTFPTPRLSLTPMIDVVFLLLVFFVLAVHPEDILAHLDVSRPGPGGGAELPLLRITILPEGYVLNGKAVALPEMDALLTRIASLSTRPSVVITCDTASPHAGLIKVLDLCAKAGLERLALFSRTSP